VAERPGRETPEPIYFESPEALRAWFEANHETADELWIGYHKKATGRPSVSWSETVDEALCFGWIDGVRYSVDAERFKQRLTPRRNGSNWSAINVAKVERMTAEGRMRPAGLAAFARRTEARTGVYSYEQRHAARLTDEELARFQADVAAWQWFQSRPASYRTAAVWWVASPKRPETRDRRFRSLVEESAAGRMPKALTPPGRERDGSPSR
jgi:uncharacterized protein YdeI (YjbR/CyaY-like superfamily)